MKRTRCFLALAALLLSSMSLRAQEPRGEYSIEEQIEFARTLRDKKGYLDLAVQYLEGIPNLTDELRPVVQLELAKTRLMMARGLDPEERLDAIGQARKELELFLKTFGNSKEAAVVRLELRRLPAEQAQATLSLALRSRGSEKLELAEQAKKYFLQAQTEIEASMKDPDVNGDQALYDLAVNKMEQTRCYVNAANNEVIRNQRADLVADARKRFEDLSKKGNNRIALSSRAWLIKCCSEDEGSDPLKADEYYEQVRNLPTKEAEEARRLARYFEMVRIPQIQTPKNPITKLNRVERYQKVQSEAESWLRSYPAHSKTPLGYGVRYELANAIYNQALAMKEGEKKREELFSQAQDLLYALNESDNDLIGKVGELRSKIALVHVSSKAQEKINELATFDQCYIRGIVEFDRVENLAKKYGQAMDEYEEARKRTMDREKDKSADAKARKQARDEEAKKKAKVKEVENDLRDRLRNVTDALSRALLVADRRTPRYSLENARASLLDAFAMRENPLLTGTPYRTVIYGESIARANPPSKHGPRAVELAIDALIRVINTDPSTANRNRLRSLAEFATSPERSKIWEKHPVTGLAHFHLAMLDQAEATLFFAEAEKTKGDAESLKKGRAKFQQALEHFRKIPASDQSRYYYARSRAVFVALETRDKVSFPEEKKYYRDEMRKLIGELPPQLAEGVDPAAAVIYFQARMEESKLLFEEAVQLAAKKDAGGSAKKFKDLADFLDRITKELDSPTVKKSKIDADRLKQLAFYVEFMEKRAVLGQADFEFRAGNYDKVLEPALTGKVVDFVAKKAQTDPIVRLQDFQITGQIVSLALRANLQKGNLDEARKLLKLLENVKDEKKGKEDENAVAEATGPVRTLVNDLDAQIRELQRKGDRAGLKRMQANVTEFLDAMQKEPDRKLDKKVLFSLARCYDTLEQHEKSAGLYKLFLATPDPGRQDVVPEYLNKAKKEKFSNEEELELQAYCYAQAMLARQLRLSKKPAEAKKILDFVAAQVNARQLLYVEKEQIFLLQDSGLYGTASTRWENFMKSAAFKSLGGDEDRKRVYFDAYFNRSYCYCMYSQSDKVKAGGKGGPFLAKAAEYLVRLEFSPNGKEGWKMIEHRVEELLEQQRALKDEYEKQKAVMKSVS